MNYRSFVVVVPVVECVILPSFVLPFRLSRYGNYCTLSIDLPYSSQGVEDMHNVGFIHRDLKPTNLAIGNKVYGSSTVPIDNYRITQLKHAVFLFDFGLARQIMTMKDGKLTLREPRKKVYCSSHSIDLPYSLLRFHFVVPFATVPSMSTRQRNREGTMICGTVALQYPILTVIIVGRFSIQ